MKKILALTAIVASFGLVACSDDDSGSSSGACIEKNAAGVIQGCTEAEYITEANCTENSDEESVMEYASSCPTQGLVKSCKQTLENMTWTFYAYDAATAVDCDQAAE